MTHFEHLHISLYKSPMSLCPAWLEVLSINVGMNVGNTWRMLKMVEMVIAFANQPQKD